jgi:hypothetical protein
MAKRAPKNGKQGTGGRTAGGATFPRVSLTKALRIPRGIVEQNAGKPCSDEQAASFVGVKLSGGVRTEIASAIKFGLLRRDADKLVVTDLAKRIIRPKDANEGLDGLRDAVQKAPEVGDVYQHYRGENLPAAEFLNNALVDTFGIPADKLTEFTAVFLETLDAAKLLEQKGDSKRILDTTHGASAAGDSGADIARAGKRAGVVAGDTCFVMMPFAPPLGTYYDQVYKPAIQKAGFVPVRADSDMFRTGKMMDQIWRGISDAKVLVAELTSKNPNVFYELGLAHALNKPVVLVSATDADVPFDLRHIRVIYYEVTDPFWGPKLVDKVAENIVSAVANPEEAMFKTLLSATSHS